MKKGKKHLPIKLYTTMLPNIKLIGNSNIILFTLVIMTYTDLTRDISAAAFKLVHM